MIINNTFSQDLLVNNDVSPLNNLLTPTISSDPGTTPLGAGSLLDAFLEPKLQVITQDNQVLTLKELRGKFVILYFFASWCSSCAPELKTLSKLQDELKFLDIKDFYIMPISIDYKNVDQVSLFFNSLNIKNINFFMDANKSAMNALNVKSLPTTLLIDQNGYIFEKIDKNINWSTKEVINHILELIKQKGSEAIATDSRKHFDGNSTSDMVFQKPSGKKITIIN